MPGLHRSRAWRPAPACRSAKERITPSTWSACSGSGCASSRTAWCSALDSGRRRLWSGRASSLPVPQPLRTAWPRSALSSTVLPTPRSPVSTSDRSGRPLGHPLQHHVEGAQLLVAAGQLGRALPGAGRVGVPDRIHGYDGMGPSSGFRRFRGVGVSGEPGAGGVVRAVQAGAQHVDQLGAPRRSRAGTTRRRRCRATARAPRGRPRSARRPGARGRRRGRRGRSTPALAAAGRRSSIHHAPQVPALSPVDRRRRLDSP